MNFTFVPVELCRVDDKQAHYFVSCAQRNNMHVVEVNNKYFILIVNEYSYRSPSAVFKNISNGIYVFK